MSKLPYRLALSVLALVPACSPTPDTTTTESSSTTDTGESTSTSNGVTTENPSTTATTEPTSTSGPTSTTDPTATSSTDVTTDSSSSASASSSGGVGPTCDDQVLNGGETDIDCGGPDCSQCADGQLCNADTDCVNGSCFDGQCGPPPATCEDGQLNGNETDLDCGGPDCAPCADGLMCLAPEDCASKSCDAGVCLAPACDDNIVNGAETDLDCGGPDCKACENGLACAEDGDCASDTCINGVCTAPACDDMKLNGGETDIDCGGPDCDPCADGQQCMMNADCTSGTCGMNVCQAISCMDGIKNGNETDIDCGGPDCEPCSIPGLVINEVDYDNVGTDTAEFIELLNNTAAPISLMGHQVVLVNGSNNLPYATINLQNAGTINPGQYLVIAPANFMVPNGVLKVNFAGAQDQIQNGAPDGVVLVNTLTMKAIDALAYEGAMPAINVPNVGMINLVEGMALPAMVADSSADQGSLARLPNGYDGNNAATDWVFSKMPTPGAANVP